MKVAIIGAGKLGRKITEALLGGDNSITLVDQNEALLQKISTQLDLLTVPANAMEIDFLKSLELGTYDHLVAAVDSDEKNILICAFAKTLGCPSVIARIRDPEHVNQIDFIKESMHIDLIVNPDMSIATEISKYLVLRRNLTDEYFSGGNAGMVEFSTEKLPVIENKTCREVTNMLDEMHIVAISRDGKIIVPRSFEVIQKEDYLYVIGKKEQVRKLENIVHENRVYTNLKKVMIAGGGKSGFYLAQKLSNFGVFVKIIDNDKERCRYLSEHLENVLVLNGDATDLALLEDENLSGMDAFVAATGYDEDNLLLSLSAKQHGIDEVVAKVSRKSYTELIEKLGINMALNPLDIIASDIMRFMKGSKLVVSSQLIQGQATIMEMIATSNMHFLNKPLSTINVPEGVKITVIIRNDDVIIPNASTEIHADDKMIIFALLTSMPALENLFRSKGGLFK